MRIRLTTVFYSFLLVSILLLSSLLYVVANGSQRSIAKAAERLRESASERVSRQIENYLYQVEDSVRALEKSFVLHTCKAEDRRSVESCLLSTLLSNQELTEVSLTAATLLGYEENGAARLAPTGRWQLSLFREAPGRDSPFCVRSVEERGTGFVARTRCRAPSSLLLAEDASTSQETVPDPTDTLSFTTPSRLEYRDRFLWTDLSYSQVDLEKPEAQRRVVVTVLRPMGSVSPAFFGVLRLGLLGKQIQDFVSGARVNPDTDDPYRIFICDDQGRLVTRLSSDDPLVSQDDDLRIEPLRPPPEIAAALAQPALTEVNEGSRESVGTFVIGGRKYIASFRNLLRTQDWRLAIVGPEDFYLGPFQAARRRMLVGSLALAAILFLTMALTLRAVRKGFGQVKTEADRMRGFVFSPSVPRSRFDEVADTLGSLEQAKTALRAMGKYVPVDLVRQLYAGNRDPVLGGELRELTLMFTDIEDFTTLSERYPPDVLAHSLGAYFEAMTAAIHSHQGIIDKYIGDGLMVFWNAPRQCPGHAIHACRAALACIEQTEALFGSMGWVMPPLRTRLGLHREEVLIGNFGAPDRMNFTAIGDGVNLASRLEGLNKFYGTRVLASESVYEEAKTVFEFRLLDRAAVKGKVRPLRIYELLGPLGSSDRVAAARRYEAALEAYFSRDFSRALEILREQESDLPSLFLARRCQNYVANPPPREWDGTFIAPAK